jgi:hypothetical protein
MDVLPALPLTKKLCFGWHWNWLVGWLVGWLAVHFILIIATL